MKNKLTKIAALFAVALSLGSIASVANAYCRVVPGQMVRGRWYPAHRVCGPVQRCRWVGAHWRNGYYIRAHRQCW